MTAGQGTRGVDTVTGWLETHQVALYLTAMATAVPAGLALPGLAAPAQWLIAPALGLLLYATFLGIPFARLGAAVLTQAFSRTGIGRGVARAGTGLMVPVMVLTLFAVTASQIGHVQERLAALHGVVPVFVLFAAVMLLAGAWLGRRAGYDVAARRALVFSGVTRNSLVVLPLALALPPALALAPLVVVTQTLVELLLMVVMIRLVPRMIPARG